MADGGGMTTTSLAADQVTAIDHAVAWYREGRNPVFRLEGAAGTGKTTIARTIADRCAPRSTTYLAPTGKAASVLRTKDCAEAATVHSAIYAPAGERTAAIRELQAKLLTLDPRNRHHWAEIDTIERQIAKIRLQPAWSLRDPVKAFGGKRPNLIVLDEASMVGDKMIGHLASFQVPILALGDPYQLPPVGDKARWIASQKAGAALTTIHRGGDRAPLIDMATALRSGLPAPRWDGVAGATTRPWVPTDLARYEQVIVGRNETRWRIIDAIRASCGRTGGEPVAGDKVMCLRNDPDHNVVNGQQAVVLDAHRFENGWALVVDTDGVRTSWLVDERGFSGQAGQEAAKADRESDMVAATFAQAVTCHSAQGSQWSTVAVVDESRYFQRDARKWLYTAATRAEAKCVLVDPRRMVAS